MTTGTILADPNRYRTWRSMPAMPLRGAQGGLGNWKDTGKRYAVRGFRDGDEPNRVRILHVLRYSWPR